MITVSSVITGAMIIGAAASEAAGSGTASGTGSGAGSGDGSTCAGVCADSVTAALASATRVLRSSDSHSANLNEESGQISKVVEVTMIIPTIYRKEKK